MPRLKCIKNVVCDTKALSSVRCIRLLKSRFVHISLENAHYLCDAAGTVDAPLFAYGKGSSSLYSTSTCQYKLRYKFSIRRDGLA